MEKTKWYEESSGVVSSKRLLGGVAMITGATAKLIIFVWALLLPLADAATASSQADGLLYAGAALLGITGLDVFKRS